MSEMYDYDPLEPFSEDEFVTHSRRELRNLDAGREEWDDGDDKAIERYEKIDNRDPDDDYEEDELDDNEDFDEESDDDDFGEEFDDDAQDNDESDDSDVSGGMIRSIPVMTSHSIPADIAVTALFAAILGGKLDEVRSLLRNNPDWITAKDGKGLTPLHYAVAVDNIEIVKLLVSRRAYVSVKNDACYSPLDVAKTRGNTAVIACLITAHFSAISRGVESTFTVDSHRIRIVREEGAEHPWGSQRQICHLVCWGKDKDIDFGIDESDDIGADCRPIDMSAIKTSEDLRKWKEAQEGKLYYILHIDADKYGFMEKKDDLGYGALIITEEMLKEITNTQMDQSEMAKKMQQYARYELEMLKCWYGGSVYGYIIEYDRFGDDAYEHVPFVSSVEEVDSVWGFYLMVYDYKAMYRDMVEHFNNGTEVRAELAKQMLEYEIVT